MDRNLAMEAVRVTEEAAIACARLMGRGDRNAADQAAVDAMRRAFDMLPIRGTVVIGEGERDEAPMLYIGEKVGRGRPDDIEIDIALDPLEGTNPCALGLPNSISCVAFAEKGKFLHAPDTYMEKIAVGAEARGAIDLRLSVAENLRRVAVAKHKNVEDVTVIILDRPRHEKLIADARRAGARIMLIGDGDVAAAIATCDPDTGIDVLMGIGGAPEGVLGATALRCVGGDFQGRLKFRNDEEIARAKKMGISDIDHVFTIEELAGGNVMFAATGVTTGAMLSGVRFFGGGCKTDSVVMRSKSRTLRRIEATHMLHEGR